MNSAPHTPAPRRARSDSRDRYLDAAEALFIQLGYEGTSIRAIATRARSHLGTLHYFWGSKAGLFRDVCERRFEKIQAEQHRRLLHCQRRGAQASTEEVLRALIEPPLLVAADRPAPEQRLIRELYGRALTEPSPIVLRITREVFRQSTVLFVHLIRERCPALDPPTFYWRLNCALGAFIFSQSFGDRIGFALGEDSAATDWPWVADEIVGFILRGLDSTPQSTKRAL